MNVQRTPWSSGASTTGGDRSSRFHWIGYNELLIERRSGVPARGAMSASSSACSASNASASGVRLHAGGVGRPGAASTTSTSAGGAVRPGLADRDLQVKCWLLSRRTDRRPRHCAGARHRHHPGMPCCRTGLPVAGSGRATSGPVPLRRPDLQPARSSTRFAGNKGVTGAQVCHPVGLCAQSAAGLHLVAHGSLPVAPLRCFWDGGFGKTYLPHVRRKSIRPPQ